MHTKFWVENMKGNNRFDGKIILKWFIRDVVG